MNDLSALLDAAQSTTCEFLGTTINLEVYTAGMSRLTHEETLALREVIKRYAPANEQAVKIRGAITAQKALVEAGGSPESETRKLYELQAEFDDLDTGSVEQMRVVLPMMLKGWSFNGEPMKRNGEDFPPTSENLATVPDNLLLVVGEAAQSIWQSPTTSVSEAGSAVAEMSESSQTETITPLATSDSRPDGSTVTL